jgi:exodeoxyribonuclease V
MKFSPQQVAGLDEVAAWHRQCMHELQQGHTLSRPIFRFFGYAGTGKTTLAKHFASQIDGETVYCAFTGKAALVMSNNGCHGASTIHSLMYHVKEDRKEGGVRFIWNEESDMAKASLIVCDEVSMVGTEVGEDMLRYNTPILALGDPAQLPPVDNGKGGGFFTAQRPDAMLTEIHRQAAENPIIRMATDVREGRPLQYGQYGTSLVCRPRDISPEDVLAADQVLVGTNAKRQSYNRRIRELKLRRGNMPEPEDRIICLRNNSKTGIFNGGLFRVIEVDKRTPAMKATNRMTMEVQSLDFVSHTLHVECRMECWNGGIEAVDWRDKKGSDEFDYGYAMTVHKAQGSQWENVMLFDDSRVFKDMWQNHLYTALTRASDRITVVL